MSARYVSGNCSTVRCDHGATCKIVDGRAKCECEIPCIESGGRVCGSDGKTHRSTCALSKEQCAEQRLIKIINSEACGELVVVVNGLRSALLRSCMLCFSLLQCIAFR